MKALHYPPEWVHTYKEAAAVAEAIEHETGGSHNGRT